MDVKAQDAGAFDRILGRAALGSFLIAWLGAIFLFLLHLHYIFSFQLSALITTSGTEEEDIFSIWKFTEGQPVYSDPLAIPYSVSNYNWGFYFLYGSFADFVLTFFHLEAAWLPTICRLFTLFLGLVGCGLFFGILRQSVKAWHFWPPPLLSLLSFSPIYGPLAGKWPLTTRPDIGALIFEMAGLFFILRFLRARQLASVTIAALFFYAAWSFKQSNLTALAGTCGSFIVMREWRGLFLLLLLWIPLVFGTLLVGGDIYRYNVITNQAHIPFVFSRGIKFLFFALGRDPYLIMVLVIMAYMGAKMPRTMASQPMELVLLLTSVVAFLWASVTLGKIGSDTNYFIPFATWSLLWFLVVAYRLPSNFLYCNLLIFSLALLSKLYFIFTVGLAIPSSMRAPDDHLAEKLQHLPAPVFVSNRIGDLPWIQRRPPYFVVGSDYPAEEASGCHFALGGWEGLMRNGYFGTVVTSQDFPVPKDLLTGYKLDSDDGNFKYFVRKP